MIAKLFLEVGKRKGGQVREVQKIIATILERDESILEETFVFEELTSFFEGYDLRTYPKASKLLRLLLILLLKTA
jgi:hypothetical protein